ncbi:MAG: alpha/beta hydrolase [Polyangiaceae bacterium]|nr:alpha/beta hydrolase [Polyangiaceae bacterium]
MRARSLAGAALLAAVCASCAAPRTLEDVPYDRRHGDATTLDLYLPDDGRLHPAVMMIHGGAWTFGDKRHFARMGERLARSGWVAASVNYRLLPEGAYPRMFQDVGCALAFLQDHATDYGIDPDRIAVLGYSAGGHLASLLGVAWDEDAFAPDCDAGRPSAPAAVIPGAGIHDFLLREPHELFVELLGGTRDEVPERYELASPARHVREGEAPYLLIVGGSDWIADPAQSERMRAALVARGNEASLLELAGGGHLLNSTADPGELQLLVPLETPEGWLAITDFLLRELGEP